MASPIPAPLPPWAKALLQLAPLISTGLQFALDHIGELHSASSATPQSWRQVHLIFQDPSDPDTANVAMFTVDIANITNGSVDSTWTDTDYSSVDTKLSAMIAGLMPHISSRARHIQRRYYVRQFNELPPAGTLPGETKTFAPTGPPERIFNDSQPGTDTGVLPPQASISVTERTAYPAHWGRFYLPFPGENTVTSQGRIAPTVVDSIGATVHTAYSALMAAEFFPVVPVSQINKQVARGLLTTSLVQVDDVFDVIRRRRTHTPSHRYAAGL